MPTDNYLMIPMNVEAYVVNEAVIDPENKKSWRRFKNDYSALNRYASPESKPFQGTTKPTPDLGIYLHWKLPPGLRHGLQADKSKYSSSLSFPAVPNRWLVVRLSGQGAENRKTYSWVVESDYSGDHGTSPFPNNDEKGEIKIGRKTSLSSWRESLTKKPDTFTNLTAQSNGDVNFSTFQPFNENVFSIFDDLKEGEVLDNDIISYFIVGWYSDLENDPIEIISKTLSGEQYNGKAWFDKLKHDYLCSVKLTDLDELAKTLKRTLCHGMINCIDWNISGTLPHSKQGIIDLKNVKVAVGINPLDALSALQEASDQMPRGFVDALNHGLLTELENFDGEELLKKEVHTSCFSNIIEEKYWVLVPAQGTKNPLSEHSNSDGRNLSAAIKKLNELNELQPRFDLSVQILRKAQWDLYVLWCLYNRSQVNSDDFEKFTKEIKDSTLARDLAAIIKMQHHSNLGYKVQQVSNRVLVLTQQIAQGVKDLNKFLEDQNMPYELKSKPGQGFWKPRDINLLINGIKAPSLKEIEIETIARVSEQLQMNQNILDNCLAKHEINMLNLEANQLPQDLLIFIELLFKEFFVVSGLLCLSGSVSDLNDYLLPQHGIFIWTQPWDPLFMEWEVEWLAIPFSDEWTEFKDDKYNLKKPHNGPIKTLNGRTFLTPHTTASFKAKLSQVAKMHHSPDLIGSEIEDAINNWDLLSQSLSGFHSQLLTQDSRINRIPMENSSEGQLRKLIDTEMHNAPFTSSFSSRAPVPEDYQPLRFGQFCIKRLSIIDRFGQSIDISPGLGPAVYVSKNLQSLHPSDKLAGSVIELAPRIIQEARLTHKWIGANQANANSNLTELGSNDVASALNLLDLNVASNPICGWIVPNYFDHTLNIYAPNGQALGLLQKSSNEIVWLAAPCSPYTTLEELKNSDFKQLITVIKAIQGAELYTALTEIFSKALDFKMHFNTENASFYTAITGKPIALVNAQWQLELMQPPYLDLSWRKVRELMKACIQSVISDLSEESPLNKPAVQAEILGYQFSVHLGNPNLSQDGLLGYFQMDDKQEIEQIFYSVYPALDVNSSTVVCIDGNEFKLKLSNDYKNTLLMMDPLLPINAYTGVLPVLTRSLPRNYLDNALKNINAYYTVGPLLLFKNRIELGQVQMPRPAGAKTWHWVESKAADKEENKSLVKLDIIDSDTVAREQSESNYLVDGWLMMNVGEISNNKALIFSSSQETLTESDANVLSAPRSVLSLDRR